MVTLFDVKKELKRRKLLFEEQKLLSMLDKLPNFYLEMKWDFESSVIPFLSRLAPSGENYRNCLFGEVYRHFQALEGEEFDKVGL